MAAGAALKPADMRPRQSWAFNTKNRDEGKEDGVAKGEGIAPPPVRTRHAGAQRRDGGSGAGKVLAPQKRALGAGLLVGKLVAQGRQRPMLQDRFDLEAAQQFGLGRAAKRQKGTQRPQEGEGEGRQNSEPHGVRQGGKNTGQQRKRQHGRDQDGGETRGPQTLEADGSPGLK